MYIYLCMCTCMYICMYIYVYICIRIYTLVGKKSRVLVPDTLYVL